MGFSNIKRCVLVTFAISLVVVSYMAFSATYIREGTVVDIRPDAIVIHGTAPHEPDYVLPVDKASKFYDVNGKKISLSQIKKGDYVKVKLFPRSYGKIFLARRVKTIRWLKVLHHENNYQ